MSPLCTPFLMESYFESKTFVYFGKCSTINGGHLHWKSLPRQKTALPHSEIQASY